MALKGIKVIELAGLAPGPFCGMVLADFGASVLRVDKISGNTDLDSLGNGKQSIALNLKHPKGVGILRALCRRSDVLIEPFRSGVMESLNLGPEELLRDNPSLIYARLTGFGQQGPYSQRAGHDLNYLAMSGLLSLFGRHHEKPTFPANLAADFGGGGLMCALGILLALFERTKSGLGQVVDNSMTDGTAYLGSWLYRSQSLPIWGESRGKNILDGGSHFYDTYETKDGKFISVAAIEPQFYSQLLRVLCLDEDKAPHYTDFDESSKLFSQIFKEKTRDEWEEIFRNVDACVAPVLSLEEAATHEHNRESKTFTRTQNVISPNPAPKLSRTPGSSVATEPRPQCGEHTAQVLRTLKFSREEILELEESGVIQCHTTSKL